VKIEKPYLSLLVPCLLFLVLLLPLTDGFTDDGYIHIQYARNIMTRGEYSFNPGVVSFGTTSPLWVLLQAACGIVGGGADSLVQSSRVSSWVSGFLALIAIFFLMRALSREWLLAFLASLAFAADAWFVRWTAMSMETASAALAMVLVGLASVRAYSDKRWALMLGFFLGVASLLRPEAYLFFAVYLFSLFLRGGNVDTRCALRTIGMYCAVMIPWLLFAKFHIGSFLPNTAGAKSGGLITNPIIFIQKFSPIVKIIGSTQGILVLSIVASMFICGRKSCVFDRSCRFLALCVVALPLAYVVFDMQVLSRYLLLVTPFITVFGIAACGEIFRTLKFHERTRALALVVVTLLTIIISAGFYITVVAPPSKAFSRDLTHELKALALYLNEHSDEDAVVAAADIGYLAFYSDREVLDLGGLVEPATGKLREEFTYEEIVDRGLYLTIEEYPRVDYFIDRVHESRRFDGKVLENHRFEAVLVKVVDNLGIRKPGPYYYTLYKLHKLQ
jgi:arabinofuranosyltransferase